MCPNSVTLETEEYTQKDHKYAHTTHMNVWAVHTYTHGFRATDTSLPVACTMHSWDVRGCTSGRKELAGRIQTETSQYGPILWPPLKMGPWCPTRSHLHTAAAGKREQSMNPPWPVVGYKDRREPSGRARALVL